jgi:hypothetical protein
VKTRILARGVSTFLASLLISASSHATGLFRAYLASDGMDTNPCTVAAPCRLLPAALAAVTDGGEIWMLDSANYNVATVSVTKSVTILAVPGAVGSVVAIAGVAIDASTPSTSVTLRNLVIVPFPAGGGTDGVMVNGASKFAMEDSIVSGHEQRGIAVQSPTRVRITNCIFRDNGSFGIGLSGAATAEISNSRFLSNTVGVSVFGDSAQVTSAAISDSTLSANSASGVQVLADGSAANNARAAVTRSTLSNNGNTGIFVGTISGVNANVVATVGSNMITGNPTGMAQSGVGSTLESLGNNLVRQNNNPSIGTITTVSPL